MNILHITAGVGKPSFGVAPVVMGLAREQQKLGHFVQIWHTDSAENEHWAVGYSGLDISTFRSFPTVGPRQLGYSSAMEAAAMQDGGQFDILHHHGLWLALSRATIKWRKKYNRPTIVAPHGMLAPWAMTLSRSKKKLAYMLYERRNLTGASCIHACSELESQHAKAFGLDRPVAIIPNAVEESWLRSSGDADRFRRSYGLSSEAFVVLYMGRLAPIKRIPMLLEAIGQIKDIPHLRLILAGDGTDEYTAELRQVAAEKQITDAVTFTGALYDQEKRDAFAAADVFVLPSHSENFGIVIAEALAAGVPAIATKGTPWSELVTHKCGWWAEPTKESLASALMEALAAPKAELIIMGENGRRLVESKYTWEICGKTSVEAYEWLMQGGKSPECARSADGK